MKPIYGAAIMPAAYTSCLFYLHLLVTQCEHYEARPESKGTSRVRPIGNFFCLLWQHCRRPWSFTCEPCSFDSGRTGFVWVKRVWNGSADPKSRQMRGAFRHTISQPKRWTHRKGMSFWTPLWLEMKLGVFTTLLNPSNNHCNGAIRWWSARRSHDVVQRAGGRLLWLGDTEAVSKT